MPAITKYMTLILFFLASTVATAHENHQESTFKKIAENYLVIQAALANDTIDGVAANAVAITKSTAALATDFDVQKAGVDTAGAESLIKLLPGLQIAAVALSKAESIDAARAAFGNLSDAMVSYRNLAIGEVPQVAYCPMAKQSWLQNGVKITNPYYGSSMLRCGSIVKK